MLEVIILSVFYCFHEFPSRETALFKSGSFLLQEFGAEEKTFFYFQQYKNE